MENNKSKFNFSIFGKAVGFLALEILAVLAFGLGNSFIFYFVILFVLLGVTAIVTCKQINIDGLTTFAFFLFPTLIYGLLSALSSFNQDPLLNLQGGMMTFVPITLVVASCVGYFLSLIKEFKLKYVLIVVYSSIALITLINLFVTLIEFQPFYTIIYNGKYLYYDGRPSELSISDMAYALVGFETREVSLSYFSIFPSMLLSSFIPLFFLNFKEEKKLFICYLAFGLIGAVSLILTPSIGTLISDAVVAITVALIILSIKFHWNGKIFKGVLIGLGALIVIAFLVVFINAQGNNALSNMIASNGFLNRILNDNRLAKSLNSIFVGYFNITKTTQGTSFGKIFGYPTFNSREYSGGIQLSGSFLADNLVVSGLFGSLFFIFLLVLGIRRLVIYYRNDQDNKIEKMMLLGFVLTFFAYSFVNFDTSIYIFSGELMPIYESGLFLLCLIFMAYSYGKTVNVPKKSAIAEENEEVEECRNEEISL